MSEIEKPASVIGVVSATLAVTGMFLAAILVTFWIAGSMFEEHDVDILNSAVMDAAAIVSVLTCLTLEFFALVLGIIGLFQKAQRRISAVLGTAISGAAFVAVVLLMIAAWLDGSSATPVVP